jgi:hypothetical protein
VSLRRQRDAARNLAAARERDVAQALGPRNRRCQVESEAALR